MKKITNLAGEMKDIGSKNETEIMFSGLNQGNDQNLRNQIEKNNNKLKRLIHRQIYIGRFCLS